MCARRVYCSSSGRYCVCVWCVCVWLCWHAGFVLMGFVSASNAIPASLCTVLFSAPSEGLLPWLVNLASTNPKQLSSFARGCGCVSLYACVSIFVCLCMCVGGGNKPFSTVGESASVSWRWCVYLYDWVYMYVWEGNNTMFINAMGDGICDWTCLSVCLRACVCVSVQWEATSQRPSTHFSSPLICSSRSCCCWACEWRLLIRTDRRPRRTHTATGVTIVPANCLGDPT